MSSTRVAPRGSSRDAPACPTVALALLLAFVAAAAAWVPSGAPRHPRPSSIHELRIEVGRYTIRAFCTEGRREVLLLHGEGAGADTWRPVLERLDASVGACAYDRRGSGESLPAPEDRGWFELADEMRQIHLALGFERDYVLVGHALGGLYARLFAAERPTDVSGLVLVDPSHEDLPGRLRTGMPPDAWEAWMRTRAAPNRDGVREIDIAARARVHRLHDIPVTVITASVRPDGDGWDARFVNEGFRQVHAAILRGITQARHVPAERSGPDVQLDEPWLVAEEIVRVLGASRR